MVAFYLKCYKIDIVPDGVDKVEIDMVNLEAYFGVDKDLKNYSIISLKKRTVMAIFSR